MADGQIEHPLVTLWGDTHHGGGGVGSGGGGVINIWLVKPFEAVTVIKGYTNKTALN